MTNVSISSIVQSKVKIWRFLFHLGGRGGGGSFSIGSFLFNTCYYFMTSIWFKILGLTKGGGNWLHVGNVLLLYRMSKMPLHMVWGYVECGIHFGSFLTRNVIPRGGRGRTQRDLRLHSALKSLLKCDDVKKFYSKNASTEEKPFIYL